MYFFKAGQEDYDRLRPLSYPGTDIFFLCYSCVSRTSFTNIETKWLPEILHHSPNTPIVLIATKCDLKTDQNTLDRLRDKNLTLVSAEEGAALAKRLKLSGFCETSAKTQAGLKFAFDTAIKIAANPSLSKKKFVSSRGFEEPAPFPPVMPEAGRAPYIYIDNHNYANGTQYLFENEQYSDVHFLVGDVTIPAHKMVLASASSMCRRLLQWANTEIDESETNYTFEDIKRGKVMGIQQVEENSKGMLQICISNTISEEVFRKVLEFLYCGKATLTDKQVSNKSFLAQLHVAAEYFQVQDMSSFLENIQQGNAEFNESFITYCADRLALFTKKLFFNKPLLSNVTFTLEEGGVTIPAHKCILASQCEVFRTMFDSGLSEATNENANIELDPSTNTATFNTLLEYIYTGHCDLDSCPNTLDLLALAHQYQLHRLITLCELYISKLIEKETTIGIARAQIDVIGILHFAQMYNAKQLEQFCLHFISTNYQPFSKRSEFSELKGSNKTYVEQHQWPPKSYFKALDEYQKQLEAYNKKKGKKITEADSETENGSVVDVKSNKQCIVM